MRLKLLACKALSRELSYLSALCPNNIDITWIRQGYHNAPDVLRRVLQEEIDAVESGQDRHTNELGGVGEGITPRLPEDFDAILIGYGLCSNGTAGLRSRRHRLVIPRAHDCITLFLGSKERYAHFFQELPGCFWYTASWIENAEMPCEAVQKRQADYYREKGYDEEDLDFFLESMNGWTRDYRHAAYIQMPFYDKAEHQEFTKRAAEFFHWQYHRVEGRMDLLERFLSGSWNEEDFLVVPPGAEIAPSYDEGIVRSV